MRHILAILISLYHISCSGINSSEDPEDYGSKGGKQKSTETLKPKLTAMLGKGSGGSVYLMRTGRAPDKVAVKTIPKMNLNLKCPWSERFRAVIVNEVVAMSRLKDHRWFPKLHSVHVDDYFVYLTMDFMPNGTLSHVVHYVKSNPFCLSAELFKKFLYELLSGLAVLNANNIVHGDLKPANILINQEGNLIIADFGGSRLDDDEEPDGKLWGAPRFRPLEVYETKKREHSSDLWALGLIMMMLVDGEHVFTGSSITELKANIRNKTMSFVKISMISKSVMNIVRTLLSRHAGNRKTAAEHLKDPWFENYDVKLGDSAASQWKRILDLVPVIEESTDTKLPEAQAPYEYLKEFYGGFERMVEIRSEGIKLIKGDPFN